MNRHVVKQKLFQEQEETVKCGHGRGLQEEEEGEGENASNGDSEGCEEIQSGDDEEGEKVMHADGSSVLTKYQSVLQLSDSRAPAGRLCPSSNRRPAGLVLVAIVL